MGGSGGGGGTGSGGGGGSIGGGFGGGSYVPDPCFERRTVILNDVVTLLPNPRPPLKTDDPVSIISNAPHIEVHWNGIHIGNLPVNISKTLAACLERGISYLGIIHIYDDVAPSIEIALERQ